MPQHEDREKLVMWEAHETIGIAVSNVARMAKVNITEEMWAGICEKAKAEDMDPVVWFDREIEKFNSGWVLCPSCNMKGTPFPDEDPVVCGNCSHEFPRYEHVCLPPPEEMEDGKK
jgi:hypothetical protein